MAGKKLGINIAIGADISKFSTEMQNASRQMKKVGASMQKVGKKMTKMFTLPLALAGGASIKLAADFEQSMAKVSAISGATANEFKALSSSALELGRTTRFTSQEVAELQLNLSKLGLSPEEINKSTASILDLALATGEDLAMSATVAASTMRAFGLTANDMGMIADVMADSFSSSALDLSKFETAMGSVAPVARAAGSDLQSTAAILSVLTNNGIEASTSGTALRGIFLDLAGAGMSWSEAMAQIKNSTNPLKDAFDLFGKRGANVATVIANNREEITALTADYKDSTGEAKKMAAIMDNTATGSFLRLKSALEGVGISIGSTLTPLVRKLTDWLTGLADKFNNLSSEARRHVIILAAVVAGIGPLLFIVGATIKAFYALKLAILAANPILLATSIALAAIGTAFYFADKNQANFYEGLRATKIATDKLASGISKGVAEYKILESQLKHTTYESGKRKKLIDQINSTYGTTIKNIKDESSFLTQLSSVYETVYNGIKKRVILQLSEKKILPMLDRQTILMERVNELARIYNVTRDAEGDFVVGDPRSLELFATGVAGVRDEIYYLDGEINKVTESSAKLLSKLDGFGKEIDPTKVGGGGGGGGGDSDGVPSDLKHTRTETIITDYRANVDEAMDSIVTLERAKLGLAMADENNKKIWQDYINTIKNPVKSEVDLSDVFTATNTKNWQEYVKVVEKPIDISGVFTSEQLNALERAQIGLKGATDGTRVAWEKYTESIVDAGNAGVTMSNGLNVFSTDQKRAVGDVIDANEFWIESNGKVEDSVKSLGESLGEVVTKMKEGFAQMIGGVAADAFERLGRTMAGSKTTFRTFGTDILRSVAEFAGKFGQLLIATAIASKTFKESILTHPGLAIAAGAALLILSGAVKNHLGNVDAKLASAGGGGGGSSPDLSSVSAYKNNYGSSSGQTGTTMVLYADSLRQIDTVETQRIGRRR
jgi:hypothetical protein